MVIIRKLTKRNYMDNKDQPAFENWMLVKGYEGLYEVSDTGRVKSKDKMIVYPDGRKELRPGRILKGSVSAKGYVYVGLYKGGKMKGKRVHRLFVVFDLAGKKIGQYESGLQAAIATNSQQTKVSSCCLGKRESHNNLKFQFV